MIKRNRPVRTFEHALIDIDQVASQTQHQFVRGLKKTTQTVIQGVPDMSHNFSAAARDLKARTFETLKDAQHKAVDYSREAAHKVDAKAHEKPWVFVGVASLLTLVLGYVFGRSVGRRRD